LIFFPKTWTYRSTPENIPRQCSWSDGYATNTTSDNVSILLGDGTGSFGTATNFSVGDSPYSIVICDFNGDGKSDIATANNISGDVSILLGDGAGSFGTANNFLAGTNPISIALGDFNSDGHTDIATANTGSKDVSILPGD